jgi:predicted Zn-dependent peptidase
MIEHYHNQNYVGEKIILTACGSFDHSRLVEAVQKYIKVPAKSAIPTPLLTKPTFHPGISAL